MVNRKSTLLPSREDIIVDLLKISKKLEKEAKKYL